MGPGGAPAVLACGVFFFFFAGGKRGRIEGNQDRATVHQGCEVLSPALIEIWGDLGQKEKEPPPWGGLLCLRGRHNVIYCILHFPFMPFGGISQLSKWELNSE